MTYLSRIRINPLRAESRRLLGNPRAVHGAVMGGLPGAADGERVLWRLDADDPHRPHLFVLTRSRPDWSHIVENAGWPGADGDHAVIRDYTPLLARIAADQEFAFRLTANPVQNTATPTKLTPTQEAHLTEAAGKRTRGFRIGHRTAAAQLDWFLSRTERWGFTVPASRTDAPAPGLSEPSGALAGAPEADTRPSRPAREVRITERRRHSFAKNGRGNHVTFHTATFEGRLRITNPALFTARLLEGIGPSKAYGCGLLTLAPLPGRQE
ncbi:type I-E CRISPR-associated protein Cas6/Cse3/CasE [Streptomyces sp. NPDC003077]|uniref:type I-E CRISPR-associated protein Cas6/Cse3/CasE n=1 Tax=Streptomyces sp. NPDC003077 TaxID=3154443 RepID=UPI0033A8D97C